MLEILSSSMRPGSKAWGQLLSYLKMGALIFSISTPTHAALLDLATAPLFLSGNIKPNVFFLLDDSGSMDWEVLTTDHWHHCAYDPNATGAYSSVNCGWLVIEGVFRSFGNGNNRWFEYIYHNNDNQYDDNCLGEDTNAVESCPEAGVADWRLFSASVNTTYYSPSIDYKPWLGECLTAGGACTNASFIAARSNPREGTAGYTLLRNLAGFKYDVWVDNRGYSSTRPRRGSNVNATATPNNQVDLWDTHMRIILNANEVILRRITYAPNVAGMNPTDTIVATLTDPNVCYNALGDETLLRQMATGVLSYTSTNAPNCRTISEAKENAANWYQYHRRRSHGAKNVIGTVTDTFPNFRYGLSVINLFNDLFVELPLEDADLEQHNRTLLNNLYNFQIPPFGTPLRRGLERTGFYYSQMLSGHNSVSPITSACQQNFTILLSDGFWNGPTPLTVTSDVDNDGRSATLADVARYFYIHDLNINLANSVPANPFDPATYQHMVTFMVAMGLTGNLVDTDGDGWPNPPLGVSSNWGNPYTSELAKLDDMWHGAFNSAGFFTQAKNATEITGKLLEVLQNISERVTSATSVAQNSTTLQTNSQVYQARFESFTWKGELLAYPIDLNGNVSTIPAWNSSCILTGGECSLPLMSASTNPGIAPNSRVIITRNWNNTQGGTAFRWPTNYTTLKVSGILPPRISGFLAYAPYNPNTSVVGEISANQAYGQALVDYLRGVRTQEEQNGGSYSFRNRVSILGDIIHSDPLFVAAPDRFYPDNLEVAPYSTFKTTYQNREAVIYSGANDGMLHGFLASSGREILAYVPGMREVYRKLPELSRDPYVHQYLVDGSPNENDVYANGWRTVLAASLRNGGQGIYALDITNPTTFTEANADNIYLFEFTDENDPELGFVHGQVTIAKVRSDDSTSGKWALIFSNGYNNTLQDGFASTTGKAHLFIVFIERAMDGAITATDYIKIPVGSGDINTPNGLAAPYAVDVDGDFVVDYVYAGDLNGTLWKFDLRNSDPAQWVNNTSILFQASHQTIGDQPITGQVLVGAHPAGLQEGLLIYFGTGKYLENNDNDPNLAVTQAFYGIWDKLDGTIPTKADLLQQAILEEIEVPVDSNNDGTNDTTIEFRRVSNHAINWNEPVDPGDPTQHLGWYLNLEVENAISNFGEKQIFRPILRNNNIIFTTILPSQSECDFGGDSWLMELNFENGGAPLDSPFDLNQDNIFNAADYILIPDGDGGVDRVPAAGQKTKAGITPTPAIFMTQDKRKEVKVLSGSTGIQTVTENPSTGPSGRQNWKQLY